MTFFFVELTDPSPDIVQSVADLFQRWGRTQEALIVPDLQTSQERSFLLTQRPRQPHKERPRQEAVGVPGNTAFN